MTLESNVPVIIKNINIYKKSAVSISNFMGIVGDERRWKIRPLTLSFCAFTCSCNLQTFQICYNNLEISRASFILPILKLRIEA